MERAAPPCGSFIFAGWPVLIGWARWERDGINAAIIQKSSELRGPDSAPIITRIPRNGAVERWLPKWIIYPAVNWTRKTHPENWIWPPRPRPWRGSKVMEYAGTCWNMLGHAGTWKHRACLELLTGDFCVCDAVGGRQMALRWRHLTSFKPIGSRFDSDLHFAIQSHLFIDQFSEYRRRIGADWLGVSTRWIIKKWPRSSLKAPVESCKSFKQRSLLTFKW